jgi:putative DNA primase/helicase
MPDDGEAFARIENYRPRGGRTRSPDGEAPVIPIIKVRAGFRHAAADEGLAALHKAGTRFYQRDRMLVRVAMVEARTAAGERTFTPGILPVTHPMLVRELGRTAVWVGFNTKGKEHRIDPPKLVAEQIAAMVGEWPFSVLSGVIGTPTLRPDGSLLIAEGYDEQTGLVLIGAPKMPEISKAPTRTDAERALALIDGLLEEFPFADAEKRDQSVNRSVALSMLLTPVLRGAFTAVPLHLVVAPQPGTGKSYIADIASMIATGEPCAVVAASSKPEETEKRLIGAALGGHPIIAVDNCTGVIEGTFLCQLTERPILKLRPLGTSDELKVANTFSVFCNGNNVTLAGDMIRRAIRCGLDANMESPETREFRQDPIALVKENRGAYVAACLTVASAYVGAGRPNRLRPLASYGAWSDLVRSALVWLGRPDPIKTMSTARSGDPVRQSRAAVFRSWEVELGIGGAYRTSELIARAGDLDLLKDWQRPNLREALFEVAAARTREPTIDARRLGRWLGQAQDTVVVGLKLTCDDSDQTRPRWILRHATE